MHAPCLVLLLVAALGANVFSESCYGIICLHCPEGFIRIGRFCIRSSKEVSTRAEEHTNTERERINDIPLTEECSRGYIRRGSRCIHIDGAFIESPACPANHERYGIFCINRIGFRTTQEHTNQGDPTRSCPEGFLLRGNECVRNESDVQTPLAGHRAKRYIFVAPEQSCPEGLKQVDTLDGSETLCMEVADDDDDSVEDDDQFEYDDD